MSNFVFSPYEEFLETGLYEVMLQKMKEDAQLQDGAIEEQKYVNAFFRHIFSKDFVKLSKKENYLKHFFPVVFQILNEDSYFKNFKERIGRIMSEDVANDFFETLLLAGKEEDSKLVFPYIDQDAESHFSLFVSLIDAGKDKVFLSLLDRMNNIHFCNHLLLQLVLESKPSTASALINKYKFDINAISILPEYGGTYSFVHATIIENANGHLKNLLNYHLDKINFNPMDFPNVKSKVSLINYLLIQNPSYEQIKMFLSPDLSEKVNAHDIKEILSHIMSSENIIKFSKTDIFEDLFLHPNFDAKLCAPNQDYYYYEIVAELSKEAKNNTQASGDEKVRALLKVMSAYLHNAKAEDMPNATSFNPLGAIVWRASFPVRCDAEMRDAVLMVAKKFPMLINSLNPNGKTALDLTKDGSTLHEMLKQMGAKPAPVGLRKWFGSDNTILSVPDTIKPETFEENVQRNSFATGASIPELILYLKEDQNRIWQNFKIKLPDVNNEVKEHYNDLFYKGLEFLEFSKNNPDIVVNSYEDISFITSTMPKYVTDILENYEAIINVSRRLSVTSQKIDKEIMVRENCIAQMKKMSSQLTRSIDHVYEMSAQDAMERMNISSLKVSGKVQNMSNSENLLGIEKRIQAKAKINSAQNELNMLEENKEKEEILTSDTEFKKIRTVSLRR